MTPYNFQSDTPQPHTPQIAQAQFRTTPQDFIVHEILAIDFSEQGEHLWLYVQKINVNTSFVVKLLAKWANIGESDVGYSGLKDRKAVTYQWFSLRIPNRQSPNTDFKDFIQTQLSADERITIIKQHWHNKKLSRGTHKHNHFNITLRQVMGDKALIDEQLTTIKTKGVPNYFGQQRFGIDGGNIAHSHEFFAKLIASDKPYRPRKKDLPRHSLYISTAKSLIFNRILAKRVVLGTWDRPMTGDVFNLDGTGSIFVANLDDDIYQRLSTGDIHIAGILFGTGKSRASDTALAIEQEVLNDKHLATLVAGLNKIDSKLSYRPLRLLPQNLMWQWHGDTLVLDFCLPRGSFATSVLGAVAQKLLTT